MQQKITLPELANMIALQTGENPELCKDFLKSLISRVLEALENGEPNVKIKGFGIFKIVDVDARMSVNVASGEEMKIPAHRKLVFNPSKELAAMVNAPFEVFEAVEISDEASADIEASDIDSADMESDQGNQHTEISADAAQSNESSIGLSSEESTESGNDPISDINEEEIDTREDKEEVSHFDDDETLYNSEETGETTESSAEESIGDRRYHRFMWGFFAGFASALVAVFIGVAAFYIFGHNDNSDQRLEILNEIKSLREIRTTPQPPVVPLTEKATDISTPESDNSTSADSQETSQAEEQKKAQAQVATSPSDEKVFDTITKTRYLTTMAKDHYGNYNLWPYIYEENKDILGHPDRIRPGTQVVIPRLSKYGINPESEDDIRKAKRKGVEIYSRYK